MIKSKTARRLGWNTVFVLLVLFVFVTSAFAASWVANKIGSVVSVWAPSPANASKPWENGNPAGYAEGDTAAIAIPVTADVADGELLIQVCLDQNASQTGAYAFTDIEPWDTSLTPDPDVFPDDTPVNYADGLWDQATHASIWGHNIDILQVADDDPEDLCGADYIGWRITFQMMNDGDGYIVYGAHIATPGDPLPYGGGVSVVPDGMGARAVNGVFQIRHIVNPSNQGADKTVNFQSSALLPPPTAITLMNFGGSSDRVPWITYAVIAGMVLLGSAFLVLRWRALQA